MIKKLSLVASVALLAFTATARAEDIDNEEYKMWSKFKAGSWVTMKMVSDMAGNKSEMEMTHKLVEVTKDKCVVETTMTMSGNKMPPNKRDIPAKVKKPEEQAKPADKPKEGSEEIEVAGKKLKCKTYETTSDANGMKTVTKSWMCDDIPGSCAKMESTMSGSMSGKSNGIVTGFEAK